MALTTNIVRTWRGPRQVMEGFLSDTPSEARAFGFAMVGCFLVFVAQWPRLARRVAGFEAVPTDEPPVMEQLVAYEFLSWMVVWPLLLYFFAAILLIGAVVLEGGETSKKMSIIVLVSMLAIAFSEIFLSHLVNPLLRYPSYLTAFFVSFRLTSGRERLGADIRLALFWSFLAASPLLMLHGLMAGFFGYGNETTIVGLAWLAGFLWILTGSLRATGGR